MDLPDTRFATTPDGLRIGYQVLGEGPRDIAFIPYCPCVDVMWDDRANRYALRRMVRMGRLICIDPRGLGASDPVPLGAVPTPEAWLEDVRVVLDAVESETASIIVQAATGFLGMLFAATHPERTAGLVLIDAFARMLHADDYPAGLAPDQAESFLRANVRVWGTGGGASVVAPARRGDPAFRRWYARLQRGAASPATYNALVGWVMDLDLRPVLSTISAPTLVLHHPDDLLSPLDFGRYLHDHIDGAQFAALVAPDYFQFDTTAADEVCDRIEEFVTGAPPVREPDRALATVLFTDIVSSTEHAARIGDRRWGDLLHNHYAVARRELERFRGHEVKTMGDGLLVTFDGPARGIRCAQSICENVQSLGIDVRAGLHTGEVELGGDDIQGLAVHIGQRVSALAGPGEVLVSSTVKDLVAGSGITFVDRGMHALKGVPDEWRLFAVESSRRDNTRVAHAN